MWHKISVPKNIVARAGDSVSYFAINTKTNNKSSHMGAACYAAHMGTLAAHTFDCIPCNTKKSLLPAEDFFLWMKFCAAFGFAPAGTMPYTNGEMNCCVVHGQGESKHRIYAGLCCYRWAECLAPMVYEACRLIEKRPDISFYRIFHYVTGKYVTLLGHSFTNVSAASMSMYSYAAKEAITPRLDHMWGLYPKFFFCRGHDLAAKDNKKGVAYGNGYTNTTLATHIQAFKLNLPIKVHTDLLDDRWIPLYEVESLDKNLLKAAYDEAKKVTVAAAA